MCSLRAILTEIPLLPPPAGATNRYRRPSPPPPPQRPALPALVWARAILLTTPTVATVGCSLTIPIAFGSDFVLHGKVPNALAILGALLVVGGFYFVSDRKESVGGDDSGGGGSGGVCRVGSGAACCCVRRRCCLRLRPAKADVRCSPSPCSSPSSGRYAPAHVCTHVVMN